MHTRTHTHTHTSIIILISSGFFSPPSLPSSLFSLFLRFFDQQKELERSAAERASQPAKDFSLKEGETLKINIPVCVCVCESVCVIFVKCD